MPAAYDSEEEMIKARKARERPDKEDDWRLLKVKDPSETAEDGEALRKPRVLFAGMGTTSNDVLDIGEEPRALARTLRRATRRLERWQESSLPGAAMIRRRQLQMQPAHYPPPPPTTHHSIPSQGWVGPDGEVMDEHMVRQAQERIFQERQRSGTGRRSEPKPPSRRVETGEHQKAAYDAYDDEGGGELDDEEKELLGEVDADEEDSDSDEEMGED